MVAIRLAPSSEGRHQRPEVAARVLPPPWEARPVAASSRLPLHQAVDHRRHEDARGDTVSEALSPGDQSVHLRGAHVDFEPAGLDCLGDAIEACREFDGQVRDVDAELFQSPERLAGSHARDQVTAGVRRERLGKTEVRVKLGNDSLSHDQHGEQER